jgi:site-specific recombinase XerD
LKCPPRPIYVEGSLGGETVRKALDQTSWEAASDLIAAWTASGRVGVIRVDIPSIADAVDKFFEDAKARQLQPATIGKQSNLLKNRLLPWCAAKGFRLLKQLDVNALREFRATWEDGPLSAYKNLERLRSFFAFCQQAGWIPQNPAKALKAPKLPEKSSKVKVFSDDELEKKREQRGADVRRDAEQRYDRAGVRERLLARRR